MALTLQISWTPEEGVRATLLEHEKILEKWNFFNMETSWIPAANLFRPTTLAWAKPASPYADGEFVDIELPPALGAAIADPLLRFPGWVEALARSGQRLGLRADSNSEEFRSKIQNFPWETLLTDPRMQELKLSRVTARRLPERGLQTRDVVVTRSASERLSDIEVAKDQEALERYFAEGIRLLYLSGNRQNGTYLEVFDKGVLAETRLVELIKAHPPVCCVLNCCGAHLGLLDAVVHAGCPVVVGHQSLIFRGGESEKFTQTWLSTWLATQDPVEATHQARKVLDRRRWLPILVDQR